MAEVGEVRVRVRAEPATALPDTGERQTFAVGQAVREADPLKPAVEGISPYAIERIGLLYTLGGEKYGDFRNWERGMPFTRCIGAIIRHVFAYLRRDNTEDHLAAVAWNAIALMHYEAVADPNLDDRPRWAPENTRELPDSIRKAQEHHGG
jgi:hypothetical protein